MNGFPTANFKSERGLRQGDPLSPFLLLYVQRGLFSLIRRANTVGSLRGIQMVWEAREITHLFFVDDSLLFMEANENSAHTLKIIL